MFWQFCIVMIVVNLCMVIVILLCILHSIVIFRTTLSLLADLKLSRWLGVGREAFELPSVSRIIVGVSIVFRMDFSDLLKRIRSLHQSNFHCSSLPELTENDIPDVVYGRISNTESLSASPRMLSDTPGRRTTFLFGADALSSVILKRNAYEALTQLGFTKEYVKYKVVGTILNICSGKVIPILLYTPRRLRSYVADNGWLSLNPLRTNQWATILARF